MPSQEHPERRHLWLNTPEEEARIQAGIAQDPDNPQVTPEQWQRMRTFKEVMAERRAARGRPTAEVAKETVMLHLDPEIVAYFREGGPGWQTRLNDALAQHVRQQRDPVAVDASVDEPIDPYLALAYLARRR